MYNLYKELSMADDIKIKILGWAGNIIRMGDERIPKRFLMRNFII
jgi:hypothetical protein